MDNPVIKNHHGYLITKLNVELARSKFYVRRYEDHLYWTFTDLEKYQSNNDPFQLDRLVSGFRNMFVDDEYNDQKFVYEVQWDKEFEETWFPALDDDHCGDCIKVACSCIRCYIEELIGCPTYPNNEPYKPEEALCEYQSKN